MLRGCKKARRTRRGEWGGSIIEFIVLFPVLLIIVGSTLDIARYIRYLQVTSFISQEIAATVYRECSDLTALNRPSTNTVNIEINPGDTETMIENCILRIENTAQDMLNNTLYGASVIAKVYRYQPANTTGDRNCGAALRQGDIQEYANAQRPRIKAGDEQSSHQDARVRDVSTYNQLQTSQVSLSNSQVVINRSKGSSTLIEGQTICQRGRVVTVEVGYAFDPVVDFLRNLAPLGFDQDGIHRETTVL